MRKLLFCSVADFGCFVRQRQFTRCFGSVLPGCHPTHPNCQDALFRPLSYWCKGRAAGCFSSHSVKVTVKMRSCHCFPDFIVQTILLLLLQVFRPLLGLLIFSLSILHQIISSHKNGLSSFCLWVYNSVKLQSANMLCLRTGPSANRADPVCCLPSCPQATQWRM